MAKPILRSEFENDLKLICEGRKDPQVVLTEQRAKYKAVFQNVVQRIQELEEKLAQRIGEQRQAVDTEFATLEPLPIVLKCPKCGKDMVLRKRNGQNGFYISCCGFPECKNAVWLPNSIQQIEVTANSCQTVSNS